jgi:hypothetical protein
MFYWLDIFIQCLSPCFHQGMGSNPPLAPFFNILRWRAWVKVVARGRLARIGPPFGHL